MAQAVLGGIGQAIGGGVGRVIGSALGAQLDRSLVSSLQPARQKGPRLETLRVQSSADGAPMACVFGRARVTGQVIWAARFLEGRHESRGGKGGPRTVEHDYSLSFAVALCEGPIDGVGRVWADGQALDLSGVTMRLHRGTADQSPDPLIEAVQGEASAYRGTAYVVFEDLPLGTFGNRAPQLSFEVFRRPPGTTGLEERLEGVCLIPGAGEFVLATEPVWRRDGLTVTTAENVHHGEGRPDLLVSLGQLEAQCPNLKRVSLVIGWFGDDLRASHCQVRPGVERFDKATEPQVWSVAGLARDQAKLISRVGDAPAYGGTPSDESVRQAVGALKARGWAVTLYPFVFMDIPADNDLPDPYGGARQAAHPWRGRVKGRDGANASADVAALFGASGGWGLRRMALHYAALAAETGADGLLIGSEMRGLTWTRTAAGGHPAVAQYRTLAAECRAVAGAGVALSYAADWSEYFGFHAQDGSGEVIFHLDPLWADANINYVGIDWYPPMGDWRSGAGGLDAQAWRGPEDADYLASQVAGAQNFEWYYASDADRTAQVRTPIVDGAHGEHWVFRPKDLVGWWSHAHHDRPGGVRSASSTAWAPGMKPIRLTEFGCAAVDRGGNAPNLFQDPKSAESFLPPFSTGERDDTVQRRLLEAVLRHYDDPAKNPVSGVYGGRMLEGADAWCWDARPFPAFPGRSEVWADAGAWASGHWLNGRLSGDGAAMLAAILRRGGLEDADFEIGEQAAVVRGLVIDRAMRTRDALEPLLAAFDMVGAERGGKVALVGRDAALMTLDPEALALPGDGEPVSRSRALEARPGAARVRFIDEGADYQTGAVVVRGEGDGGALDLDLPAVCGAGVARGLALRVLDMGEEGDTVTVSLGPLEALRLEPGDGVSLADDAGDWRVERLEHGRTATATLSRVIPRRVVETDVEWRGGDGPGLVAAPLLRLLDLPPLPGGETDDRPLAVAAGRPWRAMDVVAGVDADLLTLRGTARVSATVGVLLAPLSAGVVGRWDQDNALTVRLEGGAPSSLSEKAVLGGANVLAVETALGWEIIQFRDAVLTAPGVWRLSGLLRAQQGTDGEMRAGAATGGVVVFLNTAPTRVSVSSEERHASLIWRAGPAGGPPGGAGVTERVETMRGVFYRPWSPAHLRVAPEPGGLALSWIARSRLKGDAWDGEISASDPQRFRVRVLDGAVVKRSFEVENAEALYAAAARAADFPGGPGPGAVVGVAQYGAGWGWGVETSVSIAT
ncbi:baseplate multidomain protein megatron [Brevundimonas sp.]|uniref:baseplate multidomain protein megatron n=1 Tax=Brevundimonas sp. TaxID=1871086 RepID=UPI003BAD9F15